MFSYPDLPLLLIVTGFGAGLIPLAPGTMGSLVGVFFYWFLAPPGRAAGGLAFSALFLLGIYLCGAAAESHAAVDPGWIVWDEIVGALAALSTARRRWRPMLAAFVLYRLLDIVKPVPISLAEKLPGTGLAIMADDVLAGAITAVILLLAAAVGRWRRLSRGRFDADGN